MKLAKQTESMILTPAESMLTSRQLRKTSSWESNPKRCSFVSIPEFGISLE